MEEGKQSGKRSDLLLAGVEFQAFDILQISEYSCLKYYDSLYKTILPTNVVLY